MLLWLSKAAYAIGHLWLYFGMVNFIKPGVCWLAVAAGYIIVCTWFYKLAFVHKVSVCACVHT